MPRNLRSIYSARVLDLYSTGPVSEGIQLRAAATPEAVSEMLIYDAIGSDGYGGGVSARMVVEALATVGDGALVVRINSPGGDVFDGLAIFNALKGRPNTEIVVDGLAASAASVIAMAAPLTMAEGSMLMIHNAWTIALGDSRAMVAQAGVLAKVDGVLASIYSARTGIPVDDIAKMMADETWLTATEAADQNFTGSAKATPVKVEASTPNVDNESEVTARREKKMAHLQRRLRLAMLD